MHNTRISNHNLVKNFPSSMSGGYGYDVRRYNNAVAPPVSEKWKKVEYTESDHVPSSETYLVKSERIIEKVHSPPTVIEYVNVTPVKYGVEGNRWGTGLSSRIDDRPRKVEEFVTQIQTELSSQPHLLRPSTRLSPDYNHPSSQYLHPQETDQWSRSSSPISSPVGGRIRPFSEPCDTEPHRSPLRPNRATPVADFSPKFVASENNPWVRNSPQPSSPRSANWPRTTNSSYGNEVEDYVTEQYKYISTEPPRPSPQFVHNGRTRPVSPGSWTTTTTKVTTLTKPTNDIKEAVSYLAGSLQQSSLKNGYQSPQQQYYNTLGHLQHYEDVIDSREAQSRYGNFNGISMGGDSRYVATIDSREALRKYGGAAV